MKLSHNIILNDLITLNIYDLFSSSIKLSSLSSAIRLWFVMIILLLLNSIIDYILIFSEINVFLVITTMFVDL